jgi:hypothetical protein
MFWRTQGTEQELAGLPGQFRSSSVGPPGMLERPLPNSNALPKNPKREEEKKRE